MEMPQTTACRVSGDDPARFLKELRQLRDGAGLGPAELAARAHYPYDRIRAAEAGPALPDLPVLSAYVRGCGGTTEEWEERWRSLTSAPTLPLLAARPAGSSTAASAGARVGSISQAADTPDPSIILAALDRVAEEMAVGHPAAMSEPTGWETPATMTGWGTAASTAWETDQAAAATPTTADTAPATSASAMQAVADVPAAYTPAAYTPAAYTPASASASTAASGRFVSGWTGPAPSKTTILAALAVVLCVLVAALAVFT